MAGNYFHDPRPFYGLNHHNLISMDELFYGRKDPWYMHQMPQGHYEDPHRSRSVDHRRPEQFIQSQDQYREYRRPDFRDDTFTNFQQEMQHPAGKGNQKNGNLGNNHGGNNHGGNNHGGNDHGGNNHGGNNHGGNNHGGGSQKKQPKYDNDEEYDDFTSNQKSGTKSKGGHDNNNYNHGNKGISGYGLNQNTKSWPDNRGFHGGQRSHHRRSLSLTQTVLKKLGLRDDSSSDSSDDERYGSSKKSKGHGHGGHGKADQKPYTVRFDDQSYGHGLAQKHKGVHGLGEDHHDSHGSHGKKGGNGGSHGGGHGGQPQGILKKSKNNEGYSSDEENRGQKNKGGNNQQHGGSESGKKGGQSTGKQLGRSQSMDFRVNLCCENCERKVKKSLKSMDDVDDVLCDQWNNRVVVVGNAKPESVLKKLRKVKKDTHLWQQHN